MKLVYKEYTVEFWFRCGDYGDDKDFDQITVQAYNEDDAINQAIDLAPYNAKLFKII